MANHLLIVMSNSAPDLDDEFNRWYDEEHLDWVVNSLPGITSGRRYVRSELAGAPNHPYRYVAMYEIAQDRLDEAYAVWAKNRRSRADGTDGDLPPISLAMDVADSMVGFFSPTGPVVSQAESA
jgi:hypothetical protein